MYEIEDDTHLQILMVNDRYYQLQAAMLWIYRSAADSITRQIHPDDMPLVWDIFHKAQEANHGGKWNLRRYRLNGELMWMHMQAFSCINRKSQAVLRISQR